MWIKIHSTLYNLDHVFMIEAEQSSKSQEKRARLTLYQFPKLKGSTDREYIYFDNYSDLKIAHDKIMETISCSVVNK